MDESRTPFNLNASGDGAFMVVRYQEGGCHIVRQCLWLNSRVLPNVLAKLEKLEEEKGAKPEGHQLLKMLKELGAYPRNALLQPDGMLLPLPDKSSRYGIKEEEIVPCIQKFSLEGHLISVCYSDCYTDYGNHNLDDPLPGVAAYRVMDDKEPYFTHYIAHFKNGLRHNSALGQAAEQSYNKITGDIDWLRDWADDRKVRYEKFDEAGHPSYMVNHQRTAKGEIKITEYFDTQSGECTNALKQGTDGHRRFLTKEERQQLQLPEEPSLG